MFGHRIHSSNNVGSANSGVNRFGELLEALKAEHDALLQEYVSSKLQKEELDYKGRKH